MRDVTSSEVNRKIIIIVMIANIKIFAKDFRKKVQFTIRVTKQQIH